jgi:hypothetical protein
MPALFFGERLGLGKLTLTRVLASALGLLERSLAGAD